jgi:hypothetical protein
MFRIEASGLVFYSVKYMTPVNFNYYFGEPIKHDIIGLLYHHKEVILEITVDDSPNDTPHVFSIKQDFIENDSHELIDRKVYPLFNCINPYIPDRTIQHTLLLKVEIKTDSIIKVKYKEVKEIEYNK